MNKSLNVATVESYTLINKKEKNKIYKRDIYTNASNFCVRNSAITLIALIITIIVLLILAGVTLNMVMGDSGLFGKTNLAKERTIKAQLKEEIEMAIQEIQTEEIPEGRNVDLNVLYNGKLEDKLENIIMKLSEDEITGEYKDYEYTIDDKFNVSIGGKVGIRPEITYELSSQEPQQEEVTITVKATIAEGEITSITNPDNVEENKNEISYKVTKNGKYKFIAKSSIGTETKITISITNLKITAPVINVIQTGGYPLMKSDGIVSTFSKVEIVYEDNSTLANYYSEDNGATWKEYNGIIETDKNVIKAKSVVKEDEKIVSDITTQNIDGPDDAIGVEAYDNNEETYFTTTKKNLYIMVDDDMIGNEILLTVELSDENYKGKLSLLDENNEVITTISLETGSNRIFIVEGTKKIMYIPYNAWGRLDKLIEINMAKDEYNGKTLYIAPNGDDTTGNGTQENPYATIEKAVEQANDEDKIFIKEGTYNVNFKKIDSYTSMAIFDDNKKLCIYGENEKTILICDGTNVSTRDSALFCIKNQNSIVRNITTVYYPHRNNL